MNILQNIKDNSEFDIKDLVDRLSKKFNIKSNEDRELLYYAMLDTSNIILNVTNRAKIKAKIPIGLYTTWYNMTNDYWYLNKYNTMISDNNNDDNNQSKKQIESIAIGDTKTTFRDTNSQININGVVYNTGTINFDEDILVNKYKRQLYKYRKMGW